MSAFCVQVRLSDEVVAPDGVDSVTAVGGLPPAVTVTEIVSVKSLYVIAICPVTSAVTVLAVNKPDESIVPIDDDASQV